MVPAGSTVSRLSFWHRRRFESGFDGGTLAVSVDGGVNYTFVPAAAILSGTAYNGTISAVLRSGGLRRRLGLHRRGGEPTPTPP